MRYKDIIKEVNHNPSVIKIDYDTLQTLIYLGIGQGTWGIGYADVNNYVALIGQVGHGIGKSSGIMNPAQQQDPESDTKAIISPVDYGDDSDKIAGQYNTTTGEISINQELVGDLKPGVNRIMGAQRASTIVHEMMHRGFDIISRTPELVRVMPEDVKGYWLDDWGKKSGKHYIGRLQASAEHAMIYTHELGPERFRWDFESLSFRDLVKAIRQRNTAGIEELAGAGKNILYCRLDAVADRNSPVYNMRPIQLYRYWRDQFDLVNEGLASHFQRVGPPRRLTRGGYQRGRAERDAERARQERNAKIATLGSTDLSRISNTAARLMGQQNVLPEIQAAVDAVFKDLPVSNTWRTTVAQEIAKLVQADDARGLNAFMEKIADVLERASQ
jgi:hypothetical protein